MSDELDLDSIDRRRLKKLRSMPKYLALDSPDAHDYSSESYVIRTEVRISAKGTPVTWRLRRHYPGYVQTGPRMKVKLRVFYSVSFQPASKNFDSIEQAEVYLDSQGHVAPTK